MALSRFQRACLLIVAYFYASAAHAGGPRWYTGAPFYTASSTRPVVFFTNTVLFYTDPGNLNAHVTHAQADAMVTAAASTWNVPTSALTLAQGGVLAQHVSSANTYFDGHGVVFPDDVRASNYLAKPIAIVYDTDGSVIDTLLGSGASSPSGCRQNGVVESVDGLDPAGTIDHAVLILNGRCVGSDSDQLTQMRYQLMRAFGRVLGLAWSQLNDNVFTGLPTPTAIQMQNWPVMHPIDILCGQYTYKCMAQPFVLRPDDLSALAMLYPVTSANLTPGKTLSGDGAMLLLGWVRFPNGQGMSGVNVVVRRQIAFGKKDTYDAISSVTGLAHRQFYGNPIAGPPVGPAQSSGDESNDGEGLFWMQRVPMFGYFESLFATTEPINPLYSGDYALAPYIGAPPAMSGSTITMFDGLALPGRVSSMIGVLADAPAVCYPNNDGVESAPADVDPSGWWSNVLCANRHTAWAAQTVKAGRSWTLETTAVDENGIGSAQKARLLLGLWQADDAAGTLPTVARTSGALNGLNVGMTQIRVDAASTPARYRIAIADERGIGRPDFTYKARLLYADTVSPAEVGPGGGRITIAGQGFRSGNSVLVNGVAATVVSWTATRIVAIAPTRSASGISASDAANLSVVDAATGGSTTIHAGLSYAGTALNSISLVSAPAQVTTGSLSGVAFAVRVLFSDGSAAPGAAVRFAASGAAATFSVCGAATCTLTADATGLVQSYFTASTAGTLTLTATEQSGGASLQAVVDAVAPVLTIALVSAPTQLTTGVISGVPIAVRVTRDGVPLAGATVRVSTGGAAAVLGCGAASCTLTTDATGVAQTFITASSAGAIAVTAVEATSGVMVQVTLNAVAPVITMQLVSAPTQLKTGAISGTPFSVRLLKDGVPLSAPVRFTATGAAATFSACALSACTLSTDAAGLAQSHLTASGAGPLTLTATEPGSGASLQVIVNSTAPVMTMELISAPAQLVTGTVSTVELAVRLLQDGVPLARASIEFAGAASFASCAATPCTIATNAAGIAQTLVTALTPGATTLTATDLGSGASVQAIVIVRDPVRIVVGLNGARYLAAGAAVSWSISVAATQDGVPVPAQDIAWVADAPLALSGSTSLTNAAGIASVGVSTTGLSPGRQANVRGCAWMGVCASASAFGVDPGDFSITALSGSGQSVPAKSTLGPVVLQVTDATGHPVEAAAVTVYQTVDAWEGVCAAQGRCPAAPVLASSRTTLQTDAEGNLTVTPLELPGVASVVNIAVAAGTHGFVTLALIRTP